MKKSLFALAAVGAFAGAAQAQSSVSVYGIMDGSYTATENKATTTAGAVTTVQGRNTVNGDGALSTSRLGFRGVEDLGKGLSAQFVLEYDLVNIGNGGNGNGNSVAPTTSAIGGQQAASGSALAGFGARYSYIGLSDKALGTVRLGRQEASIFSVVTNGLAGQANNMTGSVYSAGSTGESPNSASIRPIDVFVNQAITYISPTVSGFTVEAQTSQVAYSASSTTTSTGATATGGSIKFTGVKNLSVAIGIAQQSTTGAISSAASTAFAPAISSEAYSNRKTVQTAASANYNFGVAQVFAVGTKIKVDNLSAGTTLRDQTVYEIGVRAPITPVVGVWASGFKGNKTMTANNSLLSATNDGRADVSGMQLGATYAFSKRTTAYAIYGTQDVKGKDAANNAKINSDGYALGLRHTF
jgi:predicted porin